MRFANKVLRRLKRVPFTVYSSFRRWNYLRRQKAGRLVQHRLPGKAVINLYPEGQIAELLYTVRFERAELALVSACLKQSMKVVDIGANIGLYSIVADKAVKPKGRVWAFEPSSETYSRLIRNLSLNDATSVIPVRLALADKHGGSLTLKRDPGFRDGDRYLVAERAARSPDSGWPEDYGDSEQVQVTTLDHYLYTLVDAPHRIDFLKMDIEGGEFSVFRGATQVLTSNPKILLMFECTPQGCQRAGHKQEDVFRFLKDLGFDLYSWQRSIRDWETSGELLLAAGNVWACRGKELLPRLS